MLDSQNPQEEKKMKIQRLKKRLSGDHKFTGHTILGSMCTEPHRVAKRTYKHFLSTNVGDPGLFPNLIELEKEYISELGSLLSNDDAKGMVVSGGSEANILALWTARTLAKEHQRDVIVSETCHFSFDKAANLLGLNLIKIPADSNHKIRLDLVKKAISDNTMALVGIAGTTGSGVMDPIEELSKIAVEKDIYLHVDAAFGGFIFPFIKDSAPFDFRLEGVKSITMDPHKMGRSVIQAGCIIYRNKKVLDAVQIPVTYLSGGHTKNNSILGTRSGASIAAAWMVYNYLGIEGYQKGADKVMALTKWFTNEIKKMPLMTTIVEPECNVVGITTSGNIDIKEILAELRERGWAVSEWKDYIRITLMPHVKKSYLKKFMKDLNKILDSYRVTNITEIRENTYSVARARLSTY